VVIQPSLFKINIPAYNFSENLDISNLTIERVVIIIFIIRIIVFNDESYGFLSLVCKIK
jgi:hypothetical protein